MPKVKVKQMKKAMGEDGEELSKMFSQLMGEESMLDPAVISDKYHSLKNECMTLANLISKFNDTVIKDMTEIDDVFVGNYKEIDKFVINLRKIFDNKEISIHEMVKLYKSIKEGHVIIEVVRLCRNLIQHKRYLVDKDNLSEQFIYREPGDELCLFPFSSLNFKYMFSYDELSKNEKRKSYTMISLHLMYKITHSIYDITTSPDIDIKEFSKLIIKSINQAKKSMPRCDKAFSKITESLDMLIENFSDYYKDFISTKRPEIIIENFMGDIINNVSETDLQCISQLRKIVSFYKDKAMKSNVKSNPMMERAFESIQEKFNMLDEYTKDNENESDDEDQ